MHLSFPCRCLGSVYRHLLSLFMTFTMTLFKPPPSTLRHHLFPALFLVLTSLVLISTRVPPQQFTSFYHVRSANPFPQDVCHLIGTDTEKDDLWQFNSRSLCLSSHVCFQKNGFQYSSDLSRTSCNVLSTGYDPVPQPFPLRLENTSTGCQQFQRKYIHCSHGKGMRDSKPICPSISALETRTQDWLEDISIIVPYYAWPWNIYHFVNVVTDIDRTVRNLDKLLDRWGRNNVHAASGRIYGKIRKLNIVFQGPKKIEYVRGTWHKEMLQIFKERWERKMDVSFLHMEDVDKLCVRNAVILGNRGSGYLWPFLNSSQVHTEGLSVPEDAVRFRRVVYDAFDVNTRLPDEGVSAPPPLRVGYAKRSVWRAKDGYLRWGGSRRFSEEDEKWFVEMLKNETKAVGAELTFLAFNAQQTLQEQMSLTENLGMIVGIHGANLVNSVFMRPFGVLMEVFPKGFESPCYLGGLNGGLKYLKVEGGRVASKAESGCHPDDKNCEDLKQRKVVLGNGRNEVRRAVREGLRHVVEIRRKWKGGVPVSLDRDSLHYVVTKI